MSHDLPTPPEIAETPELALLSVLNFALEASVRALVAAHPELQAEDLPPAAGAAARCAERILGHVYKLKILVASYGQLAAAEDEDSRCDGKGSPW
jgi:hypothetical protein